MIITFTNAAKMKHST